MNNKKQTSGMMDISHKDMTRRVAIASAEIQMSKSAFEALIHNKSPKGNVLETAKVAGIMAAKRTPDLIPMCHPLELGKASVRFEVNKTKRKIMIISEVVYNGKTGVEMEALTVVSVAALTIYDMMKWADKSMTITNVQLLEKQGGKSGMFRR